MTDKAYNALFLWPGNSARSIMAEGLPTTMGKGRVKGFSAGGKPGGTVNPYAIEQVKKMDYPIEKLRRKSRDEFSLPLDQLERDAIQQEIKKTGETAA
jgi:arsenate reductase